MKTNPRSAKASPCGAQTGMLPGLSGIELCREFRKTNQTAPVIFLTARDTVQDIVFGLEAGANDYIKKPFQFDELLARIRVQLKTRSGEQTLLKLGDLEMNLDTHRVFRNSKEIELTPKEFSLLEYLIRNKEKVCIHRAPLFVRRFLQYFLRKKLNPGGKDKELIHTIRGIGYITKDK